MQPEPWAGAGAGPTGGAVSARNPDTCAVTKSGAQVTMQRQHDSDEPGHPSCGPGRREDLMSCNTSALRVLPPSRQEDVFFGHLRSRY